MHRLIIALSLSALAAWSLPARADAFERSDIVLLQPESVLQPRVPDVQGLANYIDKVSTQAAKVLQSAQAGPPGSGFLVIGIRPGLRSNAWLDFQPPLPQALADAVVRAMRSVTPPAVKGGPVVLAVKGGVWGGSAPARNMPVPQEWRSATGRNGQPLDAGALVERIWRD
ncbi:MAG TPA: hypothetical protein H9903_20110 [Candidatus Aquabacterium excrementipullorum]|nr:hypothetical protein [Candidatus Aquabacterium excrementipullorum]